MAYNTVPFHGKLCRVEKGGVAVEFSQGWDLSVSVDSADTSRSGQDWKEVIAGQAGFSGSFALHFVAGNTEQKAFIDNIITATPGTILTDVIFLLDASTNGFVGNILITGCSISGGMGDKVSWTVNFTGTAALSISDAT